MDDAESRKASGILDHCDGGHHHHQEHCNYRAVPHWHERTYAFDFADSDIAVWMTRSQVRQYQDRELHNTMMDKYDEENPLFVDESMPEGGGDASDADGASDGEVSSGGDWRRPRG